MTFRTYSDADQARLAEDIRVIATQHQATPLYLWRTALEQVNPELLPVAPYCPAASLVDVYDLLDVASDF